MFHQQEPPSELDMNDVGQENPNDTQIMPSSLSSNSAKFGYKSLSLASYKKTSSCLCLPAFYNTNNSTRIYKIKTHIPAKIVEYRCEVFLLGFIDDFLYFLALSKN